MKDYLVRGLVNSKNCRVFACKTTNLVDEARKHHNLWPTASAAIGRMMSATLMMAKNEQESRENDSCDQWWRSNWNYDDGY